MPVFSCKKPFDLKKNFAAYRNGTATKFIRLKLLFKARIVFKAQGASRNRFLKIGTPIFLKHK